MMDVQVVNRIVTELQAQGLTTEVLHEILEPENSLEVEQEVESKVKSNVAKSNGSVHEDEVKRIHLKGKGRMKAHYEFAGMSKFRSQAPVVLKATGWQAQAKDLFQE